MSACCRLVKIRGNIASELYVNGAKSTHYLHESRYYRSTSIIEMLHHLRIYILQPNSSPANNPPGANGPQGHWVYRWRHDRHTSVPYLTLDDLVIYQWHYDYISAAFPASTSQSLSILLISQLVRRLTGLLKCIRKLFHNDQSRRQMIRWEQKHILGNFIWWSVDLHILWHHFGERFGSTLCVCPILHLWMHNFVSKSMLSI